MKYLFLILALISTNVFADVKFTPTDDGIFARVSGGDSFEVCEPLQERLNLVSGNFTSGNIDVFKCGNKVTVMLSAADWTGALSTVSSAAGFLPSEYRPLGTISNWGDIASARIPYFRVKSDGGVIMTIRSASNPSTGSADVASTFNSQIWSVTYIVN